MFNTAKLCASNGKINYAIMLLVRSLRICPDVSGARMHPMLYPEDFHQITTIFEAEAMVQRGDDGATLRPPLKPTRSIAFETATAAKMAALPLRSLKRRTTSSLKGFSSNYATNRSERKVRGVGRLERHRPPASAAHRALPCACMHRRWPSPAVCVHVQVRDVEPIERLRLLKMLLKEPDEVGRWAPTMVRSACLLGCPVYHSSSTEQHGWELIASDCLSLNASDCH